MKPPIGAVGEVTAAGLKNGVGLAAAGAAEPG